MKDKILVVDDIELNRVILKEILGNDYNIAEAGNGLEAIDILFNSEEFPQAVLLDIMMPEMDGFEVLEKIKANHKTEKIPVLFITAADANTNESRGLHAGAVDYITKPFNPDVVKVRVDNNIRLMRYQNELERLVEEKTMEAIHTYEQTLETLATIIEYRNLESGTHIARTKELTRIFIEQMIRKSEYESILKKDNYQSIIKAVALHDIGKVGIPDSILLKPGQLTDEEFAVIKTHCAIGGNIIDKIAQNLSDEALYLKHCKDICLYHHERWDGRGYPTGLKGEGIPISARIVSIVDVYDALVNVRCYKPAFTHEEAADLLKKGSGTQFDPNLINIFFEIENNFKDLEDKLNDLQKDIEH